MNMERINPLDLPEIIMTVGCCIPLWKHSDNLGFYDFNPKSLLSLTLVNKTWRSALLPVIWYVYNGFVMRHVPKQIILKYSVHFRLVFGDRSFPGQFLSKNIKSLVISWWDKELLELVQENAESLEYLSWKGANALNTSTGWPSPDYGLLMRMAPTLKELHLSHWTLSGQEVARFLGACKRLHRLDLAAIDWIDPVLECDFTTASSYCRPLDQQGQGLTDLNLDISTPKEDAFVDLLRYSCPDLERFTLYSESAADPRRLTPILRAHCRKLVGIDYVTRFSSSLDRRDYLSDSEYADLILAVSDNVRQIKLDIPWLDAQLTRAIVLRPAMLQSLNLTFYERRMTLPTGSFSSPSSSFSSSFSTLSTSVSSSSSLSIRDAENLGQIILQYCTNLRELSLFFNPHSMGPEETLKLVEKPWACLDLQSLVLADVSIGLTISTTTWQGGIDETGIFPSSSPTPSPPASSASIIPQFPQGPGLQPYHWQLSAATTAMAPPYSITAIATTATMTSSNNSQDAQIHYGSLAKQRLFEQIRRLSKLTRLSLNHVAYSLDGGHLSSSPHRPSSSR